MKLPSCFKIFFHFSACKRKDALEAEPPASAPKKPRLVFTDLQRRTLQAIFKVGNKICQKYDTFDQVGAEMEM